MIKIFTIITFINISCYVLFLTKPLSSSISSSTIINTLIWIYKFPFPMEFVVFPFRICFEDVGIRVSDIGLNVPKV